VVSGEIGEVILVAEGLHEKKIANIADKIYENKDMLRKILPDPERSSPRRRGRLARQG
jgi:hypothetical protein